MREVTISSNVSYPIVINHGFDDTAMLIIDENYADQKGFVIIDEHVAHFHFDALKSILAKSSLSKIDFIYVPQGEESKSIAEWLRLQNYLLNSDIKRNDLILAVGGGVIGDLAGFVASTTLRGVNLIHFPTTLLAMVDSSIGGKTGINHDTGKNRVGAFYQPDAVIANLQFLDTLDEKEWFCGLGEIIKYAAISDIQLFYDVHSLIESNFKNRELLFQIIKKSASIKANIVMEDEKEQGVRAFLNFGHTTAHAIERVLGYGNISHGVAVFIGTITETLLSQKLGFDLSVDPFLKLIPYYKPYISDLFYNNMNVADLLSAMNYDKKNKSKSNTFVILKSYESPLVVEVDNNELIKSSIAETKKLIQL